MSDFDKDLDIPGKDIVYRQDAIDALGERPIVWTDDDEYTLGERNQYDIDRLAIEALPSAQPERTCVNCGAEIEYRIAIGGEEDENQNYGD